MVNQFYLDPLKFKFCSCPTVIGCTCEKKPNHDACMRTFSAEEIAEQLTIVDAVCRFMKLILVLGWCFRMLFFVY